MPLFDLTAGVKGHHRSGATPDRAYEICKDTVRAFGKRGYDVRFQNEKKPASFTGVISDSKGTHLEADVKVLDEGTTTRVDITIAGHIFLGGLLGKMISANMIASRAEAKLTELLAENFAGQPPKRAPLPTSAPAAKPAPPAGAKPPPAPKPAPSVKPSPAPSVEAAPPAPAAAATLVATKPRPSSQSVSPRPRDDSRGVVLGGHQALLDRALSGALGDLTASEREAAALDLIRACAIAAGAACVQPTPFVDVALFHPIQVSLVRALGRCHGQRIDAAGASQVLQKVGASLLEQAGMVTPSFSNGRWLSPVAMAYALTWAAGEAADAYFASQGAREDVGAIFEAAYERTRSEKEAKRADDEQLKDRLAEVTEAFQADLLSEDEYLRMKERVLRDF